MAIILRKADSDDLGVILSLASLVADHGAEHEDRKVALAIDPVTKNAWINRLRRWVDTVIAAPAGRRYDLNEVSNAIRRLGLPELVPDLKRLLDEDLLRLRVARAGYMETRRRGNLTEQVA